MSTLRGFTHVRVTASRDAPGEVALSQRHLIERDPLDFTPLDVATTLCGITGRVEEWFSIPRPTLCSKCRDVEMRP